MSKYYEIKKELIQVYHEIIGQIEANIFNNEPIDDEKINQKLKGLVDIVTNASLSEKEKLALVAIMDSLNGAFTALDLIDAIFAAKYGPRMN